MIHAILVEDEKVIRSGIEELLPWEELGVEKLVTAENAEIALSIMEQEKFELIISDICMPGMNGVELCKRYRDMNPQSQIIFISGYSDKEYLMAAIALGAVSYVEKPFSVEELSAAVRKAAAAVRQMDRIHYGILHYLLHAQESPDTYIEDLSRLPSKEQYLIHDDQYCVGLIKYKDRQKPMGLERSLQEHEAELEERLHGQTVHVILESQEENRAILLMSWRKNKKATEEIRAVYADCLLAFDLQESFFVGMGDTVSQLQDLPLSYRNAEQALEALSYKGWNQYALGEETMDRYTGRLSEAEETFFTSNLMDRNLGSIRVFLEEKYQYFTGHCCRMNFHLRNVYFTLDQLVSQADRSMHFGDSGQTDENPLALERAETIQELHAYVLEHVKTILQETGEEQKNNYLIRKAIEYINEHLGDSGLSVKSIAEEVYLTPSYLSTLFKQKTSYNMGQYITRARMKRAEEYLKDPQYKLYQIAEMVGYEDANYFGKAFRKHFGMLPREYREKRIYETKE